MKQELNLFGLFYPSLLACFVAAMIVWIVVDRLIAALDGWRFFWHPSLARLALLIVLFGTAAAVAPNP